MNSRVFCLLILITLFSCKKSTEGETKEVNTPDTIAVESSSDGLQSIPDISIVAVKDEAPLLQCESYCNDRWKLCMQLPKGLFIHKGNTCSTVICDEFVSNNSLVSFTIHEDILECNNYKDKEYSMEEILDLYKSAALGEQAKIDSSYIGEESLYLSGKKDNVYNLRKMIMKNNSCINFTMKFPADSMDTYKVIADQIFSSIIDNGSTDKNFFKR
ncbi:hypothetical protein MYP_5035 [Sporocytophaga myxococcoides]|uniref:Lipoprotein n=1 Tax=Sporocytophaga myxococcoides TaxID=153721 RepID=A0A098LMS4_9BACT|nr:hypothetical protein [Sporocytophaga myxococcoides]GAL87804.1 hypothetical protein MYP_5035 [Sporocytophaga myxococcoides]